MTNTVPTRIARVTSSTASLTTVSRYLPSNYMAGEADGVIIIAGHDVAGWGLDSYVLPRLASGGIHAVEVPVNT